MSKHFALRLALQAYRRYAGHPIAAYWLHANVLSRRYRERMIAR